jgi:putative redox protein
MAAKTITIDAFDNDRFVAQNPRGDRIVLEAHRQLPSEADPASVGLGPMEALLAALGSCTAVDVMDIMRKKRTPLTRYRIEVIGERADGVPARYNAIRVRHIGTGMGVTAEGLAKAAHLSHEKYCSVAASLHPDIVWQIEAEVLA